MVVNSGLIQTRSEQCAIFLGAVITRPDQLGLLVRLPEMRNENGVVRSGSNLLATGNECEIRTHETALTT